MILISHRGNLLGPNLNLENSPEYISDAIKSGYDVEVDFWVIDNLLYFGHDEPQYKIEKFFIDSYVKNLWLHCKNINALNYILDKPKYYQGFWHENDKYTLTTNNYIWTYPNMPTTNRNIIVHLGPLTNIKLDSVAGVCSDYIGLVK
jgi:hypothetical protein